MPPRKLASKRKTGRRNRKKTGAKRKTVSKMRSLSSAQNPKLLIGKVHANWCGHCINLKPKWEEMEREIKQMPQMHNVVFIEIEESETDKLNKFKSDPKYANLAVSGYPTIFSHDGHNFNYYKGPHESQAMKQWVIRGGK